MHAAFTSTKENSAAMPLLLWATIMQLNQIHGVIPNVNAESSKVQLAMRAELRNGSCLGDLFSVNWMEDSDATDITSESLDEQAQTVIAKTSKSKVMNYGDDASDETFEFGGQSGE